MRLEAIVVRDSLVFFFFLIEKGNA